MEYLDGEWTEEKSEYIAEESRRINEVLRKVACDVAAEEAPAHGRTYGDYQIISLTDEATYLILEAVPLESDSHKNRAQRLTCQKTGQPLCLL